MAKGGRFQTTLKNLDRAFQKFFKAHTGFPKFKSRKNHRQSYTTKMTNGNIRIGEGKIKLPKLGYAGTIREILRITLLYGGRDAEA